MAYVAVKPLSAEFREVMEELIAAPDPYERVSRAAGARGMWIDDEYRVFSTEFDKARTTQGGRVILKALERQYKRQFREYRLGYDYELRFSLEEE